MSSISLDDLLFRAKLAEQAERYDEMADIMKRFVDATAGPLNEEQRAIFAISFKNVSGERRAAWRRVYSIERQEIERLDSGAQTIGDGDKDQAQSSMHRLALIRHYKTHIEDELTFICTQVLDLLYEHLIPLEDPNFNRLLKSAMSQQVSLSVSSAASIEEAEKTTETIVTEVLSEASKASDPEKESSKASLVFWYKMAGDYRRFLTEFLTDGSEMRDQEMQKTLEAYVIAMSMAKAHLPPSHPVRLGLALNFSVFYYEILQMRTLACRLAENSFNEAVADLDQLDQTLYQDSLLVMQLLKDNLKNWTAADQDQPDRPPIRSGREHRSPKTWSGPVPPILH